MALGLGRLRLATIFRAAPGAVRSSAPALAAAPPSSAGYATSTRRRRNEVRRAAALSMRQLLAFASQFDPPRTARRQLAQTLHYLGWPFAADERVSSKLRADFALREYYLAFEVVPGERYVLEGSEHASDDRGFGPGERAAPAPSRELLRAGETSTGRLLAQASAASAAAPASSAAAPSASAALATSAAPTSLLSFVSMPSATAFPSCPPEWLNPVRGLVLDRETAARHAAIRGKGWKLVAVPLPLWELAAARRHQHYARRDLLLSLALPLAPFEARPVELQGSKQKVQSVAVAPTVAAKSAVGKLAGSASTGRSRRLRDDAKRQAQAQSELQTVD
jgi:hypothetical protein